MNRRRFLSFNLGLAAFAAASPPRLFARELQRAERKSFALGSQVSLIAYHENAASAQRALTAAFKALDEIENLLSLYRPQSELSRLNETGILKNPHPDTLKVIRAAIDWACVSNGAFDPTVQPLWALHSKEKNPSADHIRKACGLVDWKRVRVSDNEVRLGKNQRLTLNGIAQGFAADRVREAFVQHGIQHALANTGEFCALGPKPEGAPWRIGIQHPRARDAYAAIATLQNRFFATSGDYETKFSEDFSRHHIFDPATGRSPSELASVTVLAPTGLEADALSTAIFVLGPDRGFQLAAQRPNIDAYLILKNGDAIATPNFPKLA